MQYDYLFLLPVDSFELGDVFPADTPMPLHCTVMPWFRIGGYGSIDKICSRFERLSPSIFVGVVLESKSVAVLGPRKTLAHVLARSTALNLLHNEVFSILIAMQSPPIELRFAGAGWLPHVSSTSTKEFSPGKRHVPSHLVLIRRDENGEKKVVALLQPRNAT